MIGVRRSPRRRTSPKPFRRVVCGRTDSGIATPWEDRLGRVLRAVTLSFFRRLPLLALAILCVFASGCTHLERNVEKGRDPAALREIFVARNLADNHRLAERIASALRARGLRAESGPLTMLPPSAEAVLHYEDRWTWDFGDHMTHLRLDLHDPGAKRPYASAYRTRYIANSTDIDAVVAQLAAELLRPLP